MRRFTTLSLLATLALPIAAQAGDDQPTELVTFSFGTHAGEYFMLATSGSDIRPTADDAPTEFTLFSGGVEVANVFLKSGAAPFVLDGAFAEHEIEVSEDPHKEQIDIVSISFGPSTARFDDGRVMRIDAFEARTTLPSTAHEVGHSFTLHHVQNGHLGRDLLLGGAGADLENDGFGSDWLVGGTGRD